MPVQFRTTNARPPGPDRLIIVSTSGLMPLPRLVPRALTSGAQRRTFDVHRLGRGLEVVDPLGSERAWAQPSGDNLTVGTDEGTLAHISSRHAALPTFSGSVPEVVEVSVPHEAEFLHTSHPADALPLAVFAAALLATGAPQASDPTPDHAQMTMEWEQQTRQLSAVVRARQDAEGSSRWVIRACANSHRTGLIRTSALEPEHAAQEESELVPA